MDLDLYGIHTLKLTSRFQDQYLQEWSDLASKSTRNLYFRLSKDNFGMNKYFYIAPNYFCTAFRTRNHRLPVDIGRLTVYH
jgi:hypothetical protein